MPATITADAVEKTILDALPQFGVDEADISRDSTFEDLDIDFHVGAHVAAEMEREVRRPRSTTLLAFRPGRVWRLTSPRTEGSADLAILTPCAQTPHPSRGAAFAETNACWDTTGSLPGPAANANPGRWTEQPKPARLLPRPSEAQQCRRRSPNPGSSSPRLCRRMAQRSHPGDCPNPPRQIGRPALEVAPSPLPFAN